MVTGPFWSHLVATDKKVAIIDIPEVLPVAGLRGIQLSDWAVLRPLRPSSAHPSSVWRQVRQVFGKQINIYEKFDHSQRQDRSMHRHLQSADWSRTTAFVIPSDFTSYIHGNLTGREPEGIVTAGAAYDALLQQIEDDLVQLIDPHSDQPAVQAIIRPRDVFGATASPALPDMVVKWHPTPYFLDHVRHPRGGLRQRQSDFFRGNDHTQQGFVAAARPDIRNPGAQGDIPLQQLALTFLSLLGVAIPHTMSGRPLDGMTGA